MRILSFTILLSCALPCLSRSIVHFPFLNPILLYNCLLSFYRRRIPKTRAQTAPRGHAQERAHGADLNADGDTRLVNSAVELSFFFFFNTLLKLLMSIDFLDKSKKLL